MEGEYWRFLIPDNVRSSEDMPAPTKLGATEGSILTFTIGGWTNGKSDLNALNAINETHIIHRETDANVPGGSITIINRLPASFASPVTLQYDKDDDPILGPLTHAMTAFSSVSIQNSKVVLVTGWQDVEHNVANEGIYLTKDGGASFISITGNLLAIMNGPSSIRPSGVLIVDLEQGVTDPLRALLVSTATGVFVSYTDDIGSWKRLGSCREFPLVVNSGLSYEPYSDTILAASFGRGVFKLSKATEALKPRRLAVRHHFPIKPASFFPAPAQ